MAQIKAGKDPVIYVLDGGFSSQISRHVGTTSDGDPLWSARFLQTHPEAVVKTHLDYLRAGSDIVTTNTYQASVEGFAEHLGLTPEGGYNLIKNAVSLAKQAREKYMDECRQKGDLNRFPLIAGSVGPYGAYLHDGSEYSGNYADKTPEEKMRDWHTPRINALVEAGVDYLAFETVPCQKEAELLVDLLKDYPNMKAWLSFSCKDGTSLAHGENFQHVAQKCWDLNPKQLIAIGVNCCSPSIVSELFGGINENRKESPIPLLTYPNSGEKYSPEHGWIEKEECKSIDSFVQEWLDLGVRYIGSCCRTIDADITKVCTEVKMWLDKHVTN